MRVIVNKENIFPLNIEVQNREEFTVLSKAIQAICLTLLEQDMMAHCQLCNDINCRNVYHEQLAAYNILAQLSNSLRDVYMSINH